MKNLVLTSYSRVPEVAAVQSSKKFTGPSISCYRERAAFHERNKSQLTSIVAFYNSGPHLFMDPNFEPPTTYYERPWAHVPFEHFKEPKQIIVGRELVLGQPSIAMFRHFGHTVDGMIRMAIGHTQEKGSYLYGPHKFCLVPPFCIKYVAIRFGGMYLDSLLVCQPLRLELVS